LHKNKNKLLFFDHIFQLFIIFIKNTWGEIKVKTSIFYNISQNCAILMISQNSIVPFKKKATIFKKLVIRKNYDEISIIYCKKMA